MAKQVIPNSEHDNSEYYRYKTFETEAFKILFPDQLYTTWTLEKLRQKAEQVFPGLSRSEQNSVVAGLKESLSSRQRHSLRFCYAPSRQRDGHDFWLQLIQHIIGLCDPEVPRQRHIERHEESNIQAEKAAFLRFLEDIELCIAQAEAVWQLVAAEEVQLSTASMRLFPFPQAKGYFADQHAEVTNTYLCAIESMVNAEMLLNPSWFDGDCLAASLSEDGSTCWVELQACVKNMGKIVCQVVMPMFDSKAPINYAPLLTQILAKVKVKTPSESLTVFNVPLVAAIATSLACRCFRLDLSTEKFRSSVNMQIHSTRILLQKHANIYKDHGTIQEILLRMKNVQMWAANCQDVISLGQAMSWVKIQYVLCIRLFTHDNSILQLFAYICERVRLMGRSLPTDLEDLFNDQRINGFLFLNRRPNTLEDCQRGVERWCDPEGMLNNLKLTQHIFSKRCKPTLAQQIFDKRGRVTHTMVEQLNGISLEDYLDWELDPPDLVRLESTIIGAARKVIGESLIRPKSAVENGIICV